ncbi:hypothetical protein Zm00014a_003188 [Zea mays]|uniref:Uncharacterized protein n=1 Tax=Zea mays TaxID=4577 RepID=A0A3L6D6P1_MAIZE|nr:hypothetical protein Zm00014a_003188 [Zea mays]
MAAILLSSDLDKRRACLLYKNDKEVDSASPSDVEILENPTYSKKRKLLHVLDDSEVVYEDEEGPITQADLQKWFNTSYLVLQAMAMWGNDRRMKFVGDAKIVRRNFVIDLLSYEDNSC